MNNTSGRCSTSAGGSTDVAATSSSSVVDAVDGVSGGVRHLSSPGVLSGSGNSQGYGGAVDIAPHAYDGMGNAILGGKRGKVLLTAATDAEQQQQQQHQNQQHAQALDYALARQDSALWADLCGVAELAGADMDMDIEVRSAYVCVRAHVGGKGSGKRGRRVCVSSLCSIVGKKCLGPNAKV